ncbi:opsin-5 isoform 3-T3 [Liasis olivaceus]
MGSHCQCYGLLELLLGCRASLGFGLWSQDLSLQAAAQRLLTDTHFSMTGMYSRQNASSQDINLPHYQRDGDPFASKLSKEADIIAGIYLLIIVTGKPFSVIAFLSHRWIFGWSGCRWYGWAGFFFGVGSLITMTAVSLDRYFKICYLAYGIWLKRHHAFICLGIIWSYAAFWATIPFAGLGNYAPEPFGTSCTLDWWLAQGSVAGQAFILNILFFCLVFPTAVIVFSYIKIIAKVKSSSKEVAHYDSRIQNSHELEMKLTKVAVLICAGFLLAWIPYAAVSVWSAFGKPDSVPIKVSVVPTLLAKSAAMYNPVIYQVINCKSVCCQPEALRPLQKKNSLNKSRLYVVSTENKSEVMTETQLDSA